MKILLSSFIFIFLSNFLSCNNTTTPSNDLMPAKIDESSFSYLSKGRQNMVDHIYFNVVDTNANLSNLHKKITEVEKIYQDWLLEYNTYQQYAQSYSHDASQIVSDQLFVDSLLKKNALEMILDFDESHKKRTVQLIQRKERIDNLVYLMEDKLILLKLSVTLPIINKFLDINLPNGKGYQAIIDNYEVLIKKIETEINAE